MDSDSLRQTIEAAIRRLENPGGELSNVKFDPQIAETEFRFDQFHQIVSPTDYLDDPDERDEYWLFFMPDDIVLTVGPGGISLGPADR